MTPTRRQLRLQRRPSPAPPPRSVQLLDPGLYDAPASYSRLLILATTHAQLIASRWRKKKVALRTKSITRAWAATVEARSSILNNPTPAEPPRGPIAQAPPKLSQQIFMASNSTAPHESPMQHLAVADYLYSTSINLENLAQSPAPLLNLLYTRSTRSPAQLGRWDYINVVEPLLHLFKITEQGTWDFDDGIMDVAVIGRWAAEYGLIKSWSKKSLDFISGLTGKNVVKLEPQGKYLFRWQKVLLDFCINCVLDILDTEANRITDIDFTQKASTVDKTPLELLIKDVGTISQANTQAGISNSRALGLKMQLYSPPEKFDFRHAYRLAITMLREAQDHVDLLRSDPRYFLDQTSALIDHRVEHIPDLQGHKGNPHSVESVQDSVNKLIHNSYSRLVIFNEIVLQFEDVNELCIDSRGEANDRLDEAISAIRDLLSMIEGFLGTMLRISALAGPQLRGYFQRIQTPSFTGEVSILSNTSPATVYRENPIAGILMSTAAQSQGGWEKNFFNLRRISDEVERELLENPQLKETIHPWVMGVLGMAASVYELMDALDAYVPCGGLNSEQDLNPTAQVTSAINSFGKIMPTLELKSFFGSTNNGWEALQKVETLPGGLKTLWEKVDREVAKLSPDGNTLAEWVGASQGRLAKKRKGKWTWQGQVWFAEGAAEDDNAELHQDASHLPELIPIEPFEDGGYGKDTWLVCDVPLPDSRENRPPAVTVRRPKPRLPPSQNEPLRPFGVNAEGSTGLVPDAEQAPKQKIKTRGTTTEKGDDGDGKPAHAPTVEPQGKISVSNRAYQLLVQLATASAPVAWKDFLYLMVHLGFSSIPVGGSVFRFDPAGMDLGDESISIHRPHPESEYSKGKCRQIWTRLKKNYGWDVKRFCVRENGPEES